MYMDNKFSSCVDVILLVYQKALTPFPNTTAVLVEAGSISFSVGLASLQDDQLGKVAISDSASFLPFPCEVCMHT